MGLIVFCSVQVEAQIYTFGFFVSSFAGYLRKPVKCVKLEVFSSQIKHISVSFFQERSPSATDEEA